MVNTPCLTERRSHPSNELDVVEDVRPGEVDVRAGQMDFHVDVVRRRARIDVQDRLIVRTVDEPADAVCIYSICLGDGSLNKVRACNCGQVDMIRIVDEVRNRIELAGPGL